MSQLLLKEVAKQTHNGQISKAIQLLTKEIEAGNESYSIYSNLAALELQRGNYQEAIKYNTKAISFDPYCYIAYYNRFLSYFQRDSQSAWKNLQKSLSCLCMLKGFEYQDMKLMDRAVTHCPLNAKAYLFRAKMQQENSQELAQQDYSSAIEYDPNIAEIYQQRALFFRRNQQTKQFQQDLIQYKMLKENNPQKLQELGDIQENRECKKNYDAKIVEGISQFTQLLNLKKTAIELEKESDENEFLQKLPLDSVHSKFQQHKNNDQEMLLSDRPQNQQGSTRTLLIKKEELQFKKKTYEERLDKNFKQIFEDENSAEIDQRINCLQKQIKEDGGRLPDSNYEDQLDLSDPSNCFSMEIEKVINEFQQLGATKDMGQVKSVKSANSGSKLSDLAQITMQQFNAYSQLVLEIENLVDLEDMNHKEMAKVIIDYGDMIHETGFNRYEWNQEIIYPIHTNRTQMDIRVLLKGGIFTAESLVGEGTINLLQNHNSRCILGIKQKKTCILHYKLTLI